MVNTSNLLKQDIISIKMLKSIQLLLSFNAVIIKNSFRWYFLIKNFIFFFNWREERVELLKETRIVSKFALYDMSTYKYSFLSLMLV